MGWNQPEVWCYRITAPLKTSDERQQGREVLWRGKLRAIHLVVHFAWKEGLRVHVYMDLWASNRGLVP
jgi:hypothetical protein